LSPFLLITYTSPFPTFAPRLAFVVDILQDGLSW